MDVDPLNRSFTQGKLQKKFLKDKKLQLRIQLAKLNHDNQIKPVYYLVEQETVLPSQKDDYHAVSAEFGSDQLSICISEKGYKL